jgi:hypothetical protein
MDVQHLLERAAGNPDIDTTSGDADLRRGRRALRRRRIAGATCAAAVVGVAGVGVTSLLEPAGQETDVTAHEDLDAIMLVAYSGDQPSGYDVELIPDGWEIQGASPQYLVIAPIGAEDQDANSFVGKLLVMLRSESDTGPPFGHEIPVGDRLGYLNPQPEATILTYEDAAGNWVQVQVPSVLGWSDEQIADFAAGVTVTPDAAPRHG